MPRLVFKKDECKPVTLHSATIIGRSAEHANITIADNRLSRAHCRFEPREDGWGVVDLGSQNGTFLNGRRVREAMLRVGDIVTIGTCDISFEEAGGPTASSLMQGVKSQRVGSDDFAGVQVAETNELSDSTRTVMAPAALVLLKGTIDGSIFPILGPRFTVGRKKSNDLVLAGDGRASGQHALLTHEGLEYFLEDLSSTNGTMVNGHKIDGKVLLKNGVTVVIGKQKFRFTLQGRAPETTGQTAPISAKEVKAKASAEPLSPPGAVGDEGDLSDADLSGASLDEPAKEPAPKPGDGDGVPEPVPEQTGEESKIGDEDRAALTQQVKATGSGGVIFTVIELVVVVVVAGLALFAGWYVMNDTGHLPRGNDGPVAPARPGVLIEDTNPSFETLDDAGLPQAWSADLRGGDSFTMVERPRGGRVSAQLSRFQASYATSWIIGDPVKLEKVKGIKAGCYVINGELDSGRVSTAVLALFWYADHRDTEPMLVTPLALGKVVSGEEWQLLEGAARAPAGAQAFGIGLGLSGKSGIVLFDDVAAEAENGAPRYYESRSVRLSDGMRWGLSADGTFSLSDGAVSLLNNGRVVLHKAEGTQQPLDLLSFLLAPPRVIEDRERLEISYLYFDPVAGMEMKLTVYLSALAKGGGAGFSAQLKGAREGAARRVSLYATATSALIPSEIVRFEEGQARDYSSEIGTRTGAHVKIGALLAADTGSGNTIRAAAGTAPMVIVSTVPGGRDLFFQHDLSLSLEFRMGQGLEELAELAEKVLTVQPGEDQLDRVARALTIFEKYRYNQLEIGTAAAAIESVARHFKLRQHELRDGINVPQLTRNEQLYKSAMEEAIRSAERLRQAQDGWERDALPMLGEISGGAAMNRRTRRAAEKAEKSVGDLTAVADDFQELANSARRALFVLEVEIEQRDSEIYMVSARDYLTSELITQGRIRHWHVVENYPRCLRGIEAKELIVDQVEALILEAEELAKQRLRNISKSKMAKARSFLDLVDARLLRRILTSDEIIWLQSIGENEGGRNDWVERENRLSERMRTLRAKLPSGGD